MSDVDEPNASIAPWLRVGDATRAVGFYRDAFGALADPDKALAQAVAAGAVEVAAMHEEHGWRIGRVRDPFGHHWELGKRT
jgi:uncharacterized glyoxalase superfamily protein PhnB